MIKINNNQEIDSLAGVLETFWITSAEKILAIDAATEPGAATHVFTVKGKYAARGWTE